MQQKKQRKVEKKINKGKLKKENATLLIIIVIHSDFGVGKQ
jgi:hypothetical protein